MVAICKCNAETVILRLCQELKAFLSYSMDISSRRAQSNTKMASSSSPLFLHQTGNPTTALSSTFKSPTDQPLRLYRLSFKPPYPSSLATVSPKPLCSYAAGGAYRRQRTATPRRDTGARPQPRPKEDDPLRSQGQSVDLMGLCLEGKAEEALGFMSQGVSADYKVLCALLDWCCDSKSLETEKRVHEFVKRSGFGLDGELGERLVGMYLKCGERRSKGV